METGSGDQDTGGETTTVRDVEQLGLFAAIASLSYVFWVVGGMEMVERLAYYGVKTVAALYATDSVANGGLGLTMTDFGIILSVWALTQTFVPVLTGGISDRVGYKETIFASTVIKIMGYLTMAFFPTFWGFFAGAVVLAFGTGIFKPGLQGTLVKATNRRNSTMAWGVFYQTVNIGGFIGPLLAAQMRQMEWQYVFFANAAIISLNFLLLLVYKEPGKEERVKRRQEMLASGHKEAPLWKESLKHLANPLIIYYVLLFSGFWFMLNAFFDVLPVYIHDWVDTSVIVNDLFGADGTSNKFFIFLFGMDNSGTFINPEGLVNLNAGMIMLVCFVVTGLTARAKALNAMALGTAIASGALLLLGGFHWAWMIVIAIVTFSVGEMLSSPKTGEYLGNIAPTDKKAMYLGFSQLPIGLGWTLEGFFGPYMYDIWSSKERFSRGLLERGGMDADAVAAIPGGEAFQTLVDITGRPAADLTAQMYAANDVGLVWYIMGIMGFLSALGMLAYCKWTYRMVTRSEKEAAAQPAE